MSYNENDDVTRLDAPAMGRVPMLADGDHIGNDTQANPWAHAPEESGPAEPVHGFREPTQIDPTLHGVPRRPAIYVPQEMLKRQGLHWVIGDGGIRFDLAAFPHENNRRHLGNVELRTIHAHLMEAVALARTEMRERGMVVDF